MAKLRNVLESYGETPKRFGELWRNSEMFWRVMAKRFGVKGKVMAKLFAITPVYLSCERLDLKIPQKLFRKKSARRYSLEA